MAKRISGGFVVCNGGRLEATGKIKECLENETQPGSHIAVRLIERLPNYGPFDTSGFSAEVVITPPIEPYKGPLTPCRLPDQFERFKKEKNSGTPS